jgi:hypothetical protein
MPLLHPAFRTYAVGCGLAVSAAVAVTACNAIFGIQDLTDGLSDAGLAEAGGVDGALSDALAADGALPDSSLGPGDGASAVEASSGDGGSPSDGAAPSDAPGVPGDGGDAGVADADAAPPPFTCASFTGADVAFCADFDEADAGPWNWTIQLQSTGALIATDTVDFLSPPNGFASSTQALSSTAHATFASLQKTFSSSANRIAYSFGLFVKGYDAASGPRVPFARLVNGSGVLYLDLTLQSGALELDQSYTGSDGGPQSVETPISGTALGVGSGWVPIELLLDRSAAPATMTVYFAGMSVLVAPLAVSPSGAGWEIDLGIDDVIPPMQPNALTFDNVLVRAY